MMETAMPDDAERAERHQTDDALIPPPCEVRLVLYKFQNATGVEHEVLVLTTRDAGDELDLEFLSDSFKGPLENVSWVDRPWIENLWFPEVLRVNRRPTPATSTGMGASSGRASSSGRQTFQRGS